LKEKNTNESPRRPHRSSDSDEEHLKKVNSSESSSSDKDSNDSSIQKVCAQEVLQRLREPKVIVKIAEDKIEKEWYSIDIFIQKYVQFVREVNEHNGLLFADEFIIIKNVLKKYTLIQKNYTRKI
jgi:hypothetical protein